MAVVRAMYLRSSSGKAVTCLHRHCFSIVVVIIIVTVNSVVIVTHMMMFHLLLMMIHI